MDSSASPVGLNGTGPSGIGLNGLGPLAAVDMGSNSFRLEIGAAAARPLQAASTTSRKPCAWAPGWTPPATSPKKPQPSVAWPACGAFRRGWRVLCPASVRAVATQTLREARNRNAFLLRCARGPGAFAIEVISGREEARLIYAGVATTCSLLKAAAKTRRLVIDIGGRSTELILGQGSTAGW